MTAPAAEGGPVPSVAPKRNNIAQECPRAHIVDVVAVVLAPANGNHGSPEQRRQAKERPRQVASCIDRRGLLLAAITDVVVVTAAVVVVGRPAEAPADDKQPDLAGQEQAQVAEAGEAEARVAAREAAPAVVQHVAGRRGADLDADEGVGWGACRVRAAAGEQVGPGPPHGVLDGVGQERRQHQGDEEAQHRDVVLVARRARGRVEAHDDGQGHEPRVRDVPRHGHALDLGVGEGEGQVVDSEEAVEGLDEEDDL